MRLTPLSTGRALAIAALWHSAVAAVPAAPTASVADGLAAIRAVGREGTGNEAAASGWKAVIAGGGEALVPTLSAFGDASPTAANWLRSAVDAIAEGEKKAGRKLPTEALVAFVKDTKQSPDARRIAFELYAKEDAPAAAKLLPTLVDDPSREIRRDAIAARLAAAGDTPPKTELEALFACSRDKDQAEQLAKLLEKSAKPVDLTRHFNFLTEWMIAGPFDGQDASGFARTYPPEMTFDPAATYEGKGGAKVAWKYAQSSDPWGEIQLVKEIGKVKDAVAFAATTVRVDRDTPVDVRVTSPNAVQIFLNGVKIYGHEEYHHGAPFDQYVGHGALKAGENTLVVKLAQNDQKEPWAQAWMFAARVSDATGGKIPLTHTVVKDGKPMTVTPGSLKPAEKTPSASKEKK